VYDKSTVYIVGNSRTSSDNAITTTFNCFYIGFVVDLRTGKIIDLSCTSTIRTTEEFIYSLFIKKSLDSFDIELEKEIKRRYFGTSQKAIIVAYKDAVKKYNKIKII
jgi:hypothetical protein